MGRRKYLKLSLVLTPVFLLVAIIAAGGGHGYYGPMLALFPTGFIGFPLMDEITFPFIILAIIQYPIYGYLLDKFENRQRTALGIMIFHCAVVVATYAGVRDSWH